MLSLRDGNGFGKDVKIWRLIVMKLRGTSSFLSHRSFARLRCARFWRGMGYGVSFLVCLSFDVCAALLERIVLSSLFDVKREPFV